MFLVCFLSVLSCEDFTFIPVHLFGVERHGLAMDDFLLLKLRKDISADSATTIIKNNTMQEKKKTMNST